MLLSDLDPDPPLLPDLDPDPDPPLLPDLDPDPSLVYESQTSTYSHPSLLPLL
eukprot:CAMPEP_0172311000 /NCGR_PEP_ID=MMETSP1058-20130122/13621_1 /TAXON_ID=83371 /ORGANISM="Detonula confervacea, Strain CCMP 353" /LENGTH=52 /DNA_ID=CAMNT_0013024045 /DNA_START=49 /DNA_END=203 /DNA_ORIENTATION=+